MSQADSANTTTFVSRSVTVRIRCPREVMATFEEWAAQHDLARSEAIRILALRGSAFAGPIATDFAEAAE
jgi:hypothetical protein